MSVGIRELETDVLILGGGLAALATALPLTVMAALALVASGLLARERDQ